MKVEVVYAEREHQLVRIVELEAGATTGDAVEASGLAVAIPEVDLATCKLGIFGRITARDAPLQDGDRVEVYRPITADPKAAVKVASKRA